ncbi:MAG: L-histidine N(alpha)-methyltransferase [Gemmatimonadota bacterium]|nr:MAG: L-histidine N(alpha)-methyltransferase [Gemmatimonadota bacterium]
MNSDFPGRFRQALGSGVMLVDAPGARDTVLTFARSVVAGLRDQPKRLHCRFLYDAEGSRLFEAITQQPEYYPTRTEAAILAKHAEDIRALTGPRTLVELGSGYSVKTEHLLNAFADDDGALLYVPVDVSDTALRAASRTISENFADVQFTGIKGTYGSALPILRQLSPQLVVFLGSTIGNFNQAEMTAFWRNVAGHLPTGDFFLLGVDLVKDVGVLEAAYNDAAGITARFTKNYLARMNRELGSEIDLDWVEHVATWNSESERIEISLRFTAGQRIHVRPLSEEIDVEAGEQILIEISRKFRLPQLSEELATHGFEVAQTFTDEKEWFALLLLQRMDDAILPRAPLPPPGL